MRLVHRDREEEAHSLKKFLFDENNCVLTPALEIE